MDADINEGLTKQELKIIEQLGNVHNEFVKLDNHHPNEINEWVMKIHDLQRIVMSRLAVRFHPDKLR